MKKLIIVLYVLLFGCTESRQEAERILAEEGLHDVSLTGYSMFSCSEDDQTRTGFTAHRTVLNPDGSPRDQFVEGVLCCGLWKSCTVRYNQ